jgi:hypothetical protein
MNGDVFDALFNGGAVTASDEIVTNKMTENI